MRRARGAIAAFAALWMILVSGTVAHADEGWVITSFHSLINVSPDSKLTITEDIQVDFGSQSKHGIFRTIPLRYRFNNTQDRFYQLTVNSVTTAPSRSPTTIP